MKNYKRVDRALRNYINSLKELGELGIATSKKDFTSQIGEWFVSELYDGHRAESANQKDWDIKIGNQQQC